MKFDLHIHSKYSYDGVLEPKTIVDIAIKKGLQGIAITDHNTIKGGLEAKEYESKDLQVIVGSEISTEKGEIIGLFLSQEIKSRDVHSVVAEIKDQGGIVVIPHPFDGLRSSAFRVSEEYVKFIDAIEGFNSRCVLQRYNRKAIEFATRYNLSVVAGSDAHYANEIGKGGIITEISNAREAILTNNISIWGITSPLCLFNHIRTKVLKTRRSV